MRTRLSLRDGDLTAVAEQDVEPVLEHNALLRREQQSSDWGRHVARVPNVILVRWLNEAYCAGNTSLRMFTPEFNELVQRKLAEPDWKHLRTDK